MDFLKRENVSTFSRLILAYKNKESQKSVNAQDLRVFFKRKHQFRVQLAQFLLTF